MNQAMPAGAPKYSTFTVGGVKSVPIILKMIVSASAYSLIHIVLARCNVSV